MRRQPRSDEHAISISLSVMNPADPPPAFGWEWHVITEAFVIIWMVSAFHTGQNQMVVNPVIAKDTRIEGVAKDVDAPIHPREVHAPDQLDRQDRGTRVNAEAITVSR